MKLKRWEIALLIVVALEAIVLVSRADAMFMDLWWWIRR